MNPSNTYPRTGDRQTVYLNQVVKNSNIVVGDYTIYNDFVHDPVDFEKNNVLYHYSVNHDRLIIGKFCSIACSAKFLFNSANHSLQFFSTYPFPIVFEEWGLDRKKEYLPLIPAGFRGRCSCFRLFPMIQFRQLGLKIGSDLFRRPLLIGHMALQEIQQFFQAGVNEFSISIAPFAVRLIEGTIRLPADAGILQRHPTALADQLPWCAQQSIDGDIKQL